MADRSAALLAATSDVVWFEDAAGRVEAANAAAEALLGWDVDTSPPRAVEALTVASRALVEVDAGPKLRANGSWSGDLTLRTAAGEAVAFSVVMVTGVDPETGARWAATVGRDLRRTQSIEREVRFQASHDSLTGLANQDGMEALASVVLAQQGAALLLVNVDDLKLVNDTVGYDAGDLVLAEIADRLCSCLRGSDVAARVGGDAFAILLPGATTVEAGEVAARLATSLVPAHDVGGRRMHVTASIGVAASSSGEMPLNRLMQNAELAMYVAKRTERRGCGIEVYDAALHQRLRARSELRQDLGEALARGDLHLVYQPIVALRSGRFSTVEALLRWRHPTLGVISPETFVPLLEETGWIVEVGSWVLNDALRQLAAWTALDAAARDLTVNVNVSALQLTTALVADVAAALERHRIPPGQLTVELTETALARDPDGAREVVMRLHALGVGIALDDFGTGYSSLASLQSLPIGSVKIDKSFVQAMAAEGDTLTASICQMAMALGLRSVAEGIETGAQAEQLEALGCDLGQGFLWSRPLPADELIAFLAASAGTRPTSTTG